MINDKGLLYLIQPAELVGTSRYKIGYSKNNDLNKFRKDYKKGSRFLDIYEYDRSCLLVREIRNNFNTKFKLVAGRTYYEGNENDIKKNFNAIINNYALANNSNVNNSNNLLLQLCSKTKTNQYISNLYSKNACNGSLANYAYMHNIMYGENCVAIKQGNINPNNNNKYCLY